MSRNTVTISAPAKINLGLEILGRRADGYHEIMTVMAMVDLLDTLTVTRLGDDEGIRINGVAGVSARDNLIWKAIRAFSNETASRAGYTVDVDKRIPSPGGLGGASSDAAAVLRAVNTLHDDPLSPEGLQRLASGLGSDVPFFLGSACALAHGTGTDLTPLPSVEGWAVLVVPRLHIAAKTQTLYTALQPGDFSDGSTVARVAQSIRSGHLPSPDTLINAFARPLRELDPAFSMIPTVMRDAGADHVAISGAGPAHYTLVDNQDEATALASRLRSVLPADTMVAATRLLADSPAIGIAG